MMIRFACLFGLVLASLGACADSSPAQIREKKALTLALARKMAAAAEAEGAKNHLALTVAIADDGGNLVYLERMDGAKPGTMEITIEKAHDSARFGESTRFFEDQVASGGNGLSFLTTGVVAKAGAFPITVDGETIGAISVGGAMDDLDDQCAKAGLAVVNAK